MADEAASPDPTGLQSPTARVPSTRHAEVHERAACSLRSLVAPRQPLVAGAALPGVQRGRRRRTGPVPLVPRRAALERPGLPALRAAAGRGPGLPALPVGGAALRASARRLPLRIPGRPALAALQVPRRPRGRRPACHVAAVVAGSFAVAAG